MTEWNGSLTFSVCETSRQCKTCHHPIRPGDVIIQAKPWRLGPRRWYCAPCMSASLGIDIGKSGLAGVEVRAAS